MNDVFNNTRSLDTSPILRDFGDMYLEKQLEKYGRDKRIRGFHFANEWPDMQRVGGKESVRSGVSHAYMLDAAKYIKEHTDKQISMNTNIDASDKKKLSGTFGELFALLENRARLGFDVYPSQETWRKAFWQKLKRFFEPYQKSYQWCDNRFPNCELFFCEVEAQPWGNGWSWYRIINAAENPHEKVLQYANDSLPKTMKKYILPTKTKEVSLWGAEFWLSADAMGITWPLGQISDITHSTSTSLRK